MNRQITLLTALVAALSTVVILPATPAIHAQNTGTVCIADISSTSCPDTSAHFNDALGRQFQVAVNIENSDVFDAFDISVRTDAGILNPVSVNLTGSLIHDPRTIIAECINNTPIIGSCRPGIDGYGVVSLSVAGLGYDVPAPATGRLFSITYNPGDFVGVFGESTPIEFQTGCTNTSNNDFCATIKNAGTVVPENLQEASFTFSDFSVRLSSNFEIITKGSSLSITVTLTSVGDYSGTINLSISIDPITRHTPTSTVNPTSGTLSPGSASTSTLTVTTTRSTTVGRYVISVIGTDGTLTRFDSLTLFIENR